MAEEAGSGSWVRVERGVRLLIKFDLTIANGVTPRIHRVSREEFVEFLSGRLYRQQCNTFAESYHYPL